MKRSSLQFLYCRFGYVIVFMVGLIPISSALVCTPDFCDTVKCQNDVSEETCSGRDKIYIAHGSLCGCCPVCIDLPPAQDEIHSPDKICEFRPLGNGEHGYYLC
nr:uncharacterized protein LOC106691092 isoform X2 [Halyomorpha halys]